MQVHENRLIFDVEGFDSRYIMDNSSEVLYIGHSTLAQLIYYDMLAYYLH
jgi:hypothetical protein